jgi:hypothetical protein
MGKANFGGSQDLSGLFASMQGSQTAPPVAKDPTTSSSSTKVTNYKFPKTPKATPSVSSSDPNTAMADLKYQRTTGAIDDFQYADALEALANSLSGSDRASTLTSAYNIRQTAKNNKDAKMIDGWKTQSVADPEVLSYLVNRMQTETDPDESVWLQETFNTVNNAVGDSRAVEAYNNGGSIADVVAHFKMKMDEQTKDSPQYRNAESDWQGWQDKADSLSLDKFKSSIDNQLKEGSIDLVEAKKRLQSFESKLRPGSTVKNNVDAYIKQASDNIFDASLARKDDSMQAQWQNHKLSSSDYSAYLEKRANPYKYTNVSQYNKLMSIAHGVKSGIVTVAKNGTLTIGGGSGSSGGSSTPSLTSASFGGVSVPKFTKTKEVTAWINEHNADQKAIENVLKANVAGSTASITVPARLFNPKASATAMISINPQDSKKVATLVALGVNNKKAIIYVKTGKNRATGTDLTDLGKFITLAGTATGPSDAAITHEYEYVQHGIQSASQIVDPTARANAINGVIAQVDEWVGNTQNKTTISKSVGFRLTTPKATGFQAPMDPGTPIGDLLADAHQAKVVLTNPESIPASSIDAKKSPLTAAASRGMADAAAIASGQYTHVMDKTGKLFVVPLADAPDDYGNRMPGKAGDNTDGLWTKAYLPDGNGGSVLGWAQVVPQKVQYTAYTIPSGGLSATSLKGDPTPSDANTTKQGTFQNDSAIVLGIPGSTRPAWETRGQDTLQTLNNNPGQILSTDQIARLAAYYGVSVDAVKKMLVPVTKEIAYNATIHQGSVGSSYRPTSGTIMVQNPGTGAWRQIPSMNINATGGMSSAGDSNIFKRDANGDIVIEIDPKTGNVTPQMSGTWATSYGETPIPTFSGNRAADQASFNADPNGAMMRGQTIYTRDADGHMIPLASADSSTPLGKISQAWAGTAFNDPAAKNDEIWNWKPGLDRNGVDTIQKAADAATAEATGRRWAQQAMVEAAIAETKRDAARAGVGPESRPQVDLTQHIKDLQHQFGLSSAQDQMQAGQDSAQRGIPSKRPPVAAPPTNANASIWQREIVASSLVPKPKAAITFTGPQVPDVQANSKVSAPVASVVPKVTPSVLGSLYRPTTAVSSNDSRHSAGASAPKITAPVTPKAVTPAKPKASAAGLAVGNKKVAS